MKRQFDHELTTAKPRPASGAPPAELVELASKLAGRRVTFRGASPAQRSFAASVRANMLRESIARCDRDRELILRAIGDASWFAAHGNRPYEAIRWPRVDQLATPEAPDAPSSPR